MRLSHFASSDIKVERRQHADVHEHSFFGLKNTSMHLNTSLLDWVAIVTKTGRESLVSWHL